MLSVGSNSVQASAAVKADEKLGWSRLKDEEHITNHRSTAHAADFTVEGMSCASCVSTIESYVSGIQGVLNITVQLIAQKAHVEYDESQITVSDIKEAFEDIGFQATLLEASDVIKLHVESMDCSICVSSIENALKGKEGVSKVVINLPEREVLVTANTSLTGARDIIECLEETGFHAVVTEKNQKLESLNRSSEIRERKVKFWIAFIFAIPVLLISMLFPFIPSIASFFNITIVSGLTIRAVSLLVLSTPVQFWLGFTFYKGAYAALKHGTANMDVLVALATSSAYSYSLGIVVASVISPEFGSHAIFFETSVFLITFILLGRYLESIAKGKTSEAISKLLNLQPDYAVLLLLTDSGEVLKEKVINASLIQRSDVLKVVPGERFPADGVIVKGTTTVDESMITGESMPVTKGSEAVVIGGTLNQEGLVWVRATNVGSDTTLSNIIKLVETAQLSKPSIQVFADKLSAYFVPTVLIIAVVTFSIWFALTTAGVVPAEWIPANQGEFLFSFLFGISVLVIACPCALGLATPGAVMVGTGLAAEYGVLIKGGDAIETAHQIQAIVFDKTGTLTHGKPKLTDFEIFQAIDVKSFFSIVGSIENGSEHPLAKAIYNYAKEQDGFLLQPVESFLSFSGRGVEAAVSGRSVHIGNLSFMEQSSCRPPRDVNVVERLTAYQQEGKTAILISFDGAIAGLIAVADTVKPEAAYVVDCLLKEGIEVWMVSGDNSATALAIANEVGITKVFAEVLPADKVKKVKELQARGFAVAMVGDGINDSPALAQADIGIAIGAGTDIAMEAANVVLIKNDLRDVLVAIDISKATYRRIQLNFLWAFVYNAIGIPVAAGVLYPIFRFALPPMAAGAAMALSSISVLLSSLALKFHKPKHDHLSEKILSDHHTELSDADIEMKTLV